MIDTGGGCPGEDDEGDTDEDTAGGCATGRAMAVAAPHGRRSEEAGCATVCPSDSSSG